MIIDFHAHIFPPDVRERRDDYVARDITFAEMYADPKAEIATAEDLLASMDEAGVDVSVAVGFAWADHDDIVRHNDYLLESAAQSSGRIIAFTTINMGDARAEAEIERCAAAGARGLGELRPDNQLWDLNKKPGEVLASVAAKWGLIVLFHVTEPGDNTYPGRNGLQLGIFRTFANKFSTLPVVGAHFGGGFFAADPGNRANPFVDTAAQPFLHPGEHAIPAIQAIPPNRLLFGSDFPLITQKRQLAELSAAIADGDRLEAALGENARKLLNL
ncbi:MAG: amidohydrolase family protein [Chloroflexota bacterium]